jgi:hypothetical protein
MGSITEFIGRGDARVTDGFRRIFRPDRRSHSPELG